VENAASQRKFGAGNALISVSIAVQKRTIEKRIGG
jgi:hypothetical protein